MALRGTFLSKKEGTILRIEQLTSDSENIRIIVKAESSDGGKWNSHAMLNIDDDMFVSLERNYTIITTYPCLSEALNTEVNIQNSESVYGTTIVFWRFGMDICTALHEIAQITHSNCNPQSLTINSKKLRVDYDWVYLSSFFLPDGEDDKSNYKKVVLQFLQKNIGAKYKIGNFRSEAMNLTRLSQSEKLGLLKSKEEAVYGQWTYRSRKKLIYHNKMEKCIDYTFEYNYMIIADYAFSHFQNLSKITIPNSVVYLGNGAFFNCAKLNEIHLSKNLKSIGAQCFMGCNSLQYIVIPNSVTEIESEAFMDCKNLSNIAMPDNLKHIGWSVFNGCNKDINILINKEYEEELRKVLYAYTDNIVAIDREEIEDMRSSEWISQESS